MSDGECHNAAVIRCTAFANSSISTTGIDFRAVEELQPSFELHVQVSMKTSKVPVRIRQ